MHRVHAGSLCSSKVVIRMWLFPARYGIRWEAYEQDGQLYPSLAQLYINLIDNLEPICNGSCLYVIEGAKDMSNTWA